MDRRRFAWALVVFGAALVALSALADALGLGEGGGFGYKQVTGVVVGGVFLAVGLALAVVERRAEEPPPGDV